MNPGYHDAWFRSPRPLGELPARFAILTACNPLGQVLPDVENAERTERLRHRLEALAAATFPVAGGSADGSHQEPGFAVVGVDLELVRALGREFDQDAIFWVDRGDTFLVACDQPSRVFVATIDSRWHAVA